MIPGCRHFGSRVVAPMLALLVFHCPSAARAQADASARALAVQLFDEAEALFANGDVAKACPKYAESYRLDPQLGALIYLAECYEKNGQLASAWGSFREADEMARKRGDARGQRARERAAALEPRLSYLLIQVPLAARLPALDVRRDGTPVAAVLWGERAAIDSGQHRIEVSAAGYQPWHKDFAIDAEANSQVVVVPKLAPEPAATGGNDDRNATGGPASATPGSSRRIVALAAGGLGIVGIGVGAWFGMSAQGSLNDAKPLCNEYDYCTPVGDDLRRTAKTKALISTITTGAGLGTLATAAVLLLTAPKAQASSSSQRPPPRSGWAIAPAPASLGLEITNAF